MFRVHHAQVSGEAQHGCFFSRGEMENDLNLLETKTITRIGARALPRVLGAPYLATFSSREMWESQALTGNAYRFKLHQAHGWSEVEST